MELEESDYIFILECLEDRADKHWANLIGAESGQKFERFQKQQIEKCEHITDKILKLIKS